MSLLCCDLPTSLIGQFNLIQCELNNRSEIGQDCRMEEVCDRTEQTNTPTEDASKLRSKRPEFVQNLTTF